MVLSSQLTFPSSLCSCAHSFPAARQLRESAFRHSVPPSTEEPPLQKRKPGCSRHPSCSPAQLPATAGATRSPASGRYHSLELGSSGNSGQSVCPKPGRNHSLFISTFIHSNMHALATSGHLINFLSQARMNEWLGTTVIQSLQLSLPSLGRDDCDWQGGAASKGCHKAPQDR